MNYKGIILAGGEGRRLYPASLPISKILLPIFDKPMIYYPLSMLISAGIREILIITNERDLPNFKRVLKDGTELGIEISYKIQYKPKGIADALLIGEDFIGDSGLVLALGDNIFYGKNLANILFDAIKENISSTIFGYPVDNPKEFGVIEFDNDYKVLSLEEKPEKPKSNYAAVGLYIYDNKAVEMAKRLIPSERGELEITDLNKLYIEHSALKMVLLDSDIYWQDTGSFDSMLEASLFVKNHEQKTGKKIGCIEEEAKKAGLVKTNIPALNGAFPKNEYYFYLTQLEEKREHA